ncbi:hypothetical protein F4677DRAFT_423513 [Hypoxylon crocopeplum]|nr:hypothetical protein F4677DRAFT_423513 [Hypoxylon crocopeplum]
MPFPYRYICDLLQQLDDNSRKEERNQTPTKTIVGAWFHEHRSGLNAPENDSSAILSTLLPERRTDRVYFIQTPRLESIFGKALLLGASRVQELRRYRTSGQGVDLADCVEGILKGTPNALQGSNELTVEEIDGTLSRIAAACRFSSPSVRALQKTQNARDQEQSIANIYRRLSARDAKWFTRLMLKNYQPVVMDERLVFRSYHILLPQMMKVREDLSIATAFLRHIYQSPDDQNAIASILKPSIGIKVGRQTWLKGRSIKHCLNMARSREMSCEQKIDGEYCQIHIDLRKPQSPIQIFSKSGKDSTQDRISLHQSIRESLKLGSSDCPFRLGCILEGELVVYSTKDNKILPFHKIRKHVSRSGSFLGTYCDSQPHDHEHLMIVYYDVLMIDNESLLGVRQSERFRRLSKLVTYRKGYAELVSRQVISFSRPSAALKLREAFAECIVSRNEGLVLKPDEPYFDFSTAQKSYSCCNIKLKKEYVQGWGDVGDFAVVGASYDAAKAKEYKRPNVKWTHFFIGCLDNKEKARAKIEKPRFIITNIVELSENLLSTVMGQCFPSPVAFKLNQSILLDFGRGGLHKRPTDVFLEPLVFDMRCFSFDKSPNTNFWSMRFPIVSKIHHDRSYWDALSFTELQDIALAATEMPEVEDSQEMRQWVAALEKADPRGIAIDAISQQSTSTEIIASPVPSRKSRQENVAQCILTPDPSDGEYAQKDHSPHRCGMVVRRHDPFTPPSSSPAEGAEGCAASNVQKSPMKSGSKKRSASDTAIIAKKPRTLSNISYVQSSSTGSSTGLPPSAPECRQPLSQVDANSPSKRRGAKSQLRVSKELLHNSAMPGITSPPTNSLLTSSFDTVPKTTQSPPSLTNKGERSAPKQLPALKCCSPAGNKCAFTNCSILLAPCIAQYAWITENLLRDHGIDDFLIDPRSWSQTPTNRSSMCEQDDSSRKTKRLRVRKICLVESRRRDATMAFIGKIEAAGLKKRNGEREWVAVYDWRILDEISDLESGKKSREMDPWRKHYVGIA